MVVLVIYDISSDEDRSKLSSLLQDYGLERIQYSGFRGEINTHDRLILAKEVKKFVTGARDSVYVMRLCDECARTCHIVSNREVSLVDDSTVKVV